MLFFHNVGGALLLKFRLMDKYNRVAKMFLDGYTDFTLSLTLFAQKNMTYHSSFSLTRDKTKNHVVISNYRPTLYKDDTGNLYKVTVSEKEGKVLTPTFWLKVQSCVNGTGVPNSKLLYRHFTVSYCFAVQIN